MEKKRINVDINVEGAGSVFVHKAVQQMLFDKGFAWGGSGVKLEEYGSRHPFYFVMNKDGSSKKMWTIVIEDTCNPTIKATDILSGSFDLDKWIGDSITKKEPDNVVYCVDLTWVKGEAREVLSAALQKKAFEKGYKWAGEETNVQFVDTPALYFMTRDRTVLKGDEFSCSRKDDVLGFEKEISVNKALRGEYRSVK